jgi:hypothetical protein
VHLRTVLVATGSTVLLACSGVSSAAAATAPVLIPHTMPPSGAVFSVVENATVVLSCENTAYRVELIGTGQLTVGPTVTTVDGHPVVVVTTVAEQLTGYDPVLGMVTVSESVPEPGVLIESSAAHPFPASEALAQELTLTTEHSPCLSAKGAPSALATKSVASIQNSNIAEFPPVNTVYQLHDPIELSDVNGKSQASALITQFPVTVSRAS